MFEEIGDASGNELEHAKLGGQFSEDGVDVDERGVAKEGEDSRVACKLRCLGMLAGTGPWG